MPTSSDRPPGRHGGAGGAGGAGRHGGTSGDPVSHEPLPAPISLDPKPVVADPVDPAVLPNTPEDPNLPTLWWSTDESRLLVGITALGVVAALTLLAPYFTGATRMTGPTIALALLCGAINVLCLWRINRLAMEAESGVANVPHITGGHQVRAGSGSGVPPILGRWPTYVVVVCLLLSDVAAVAASALIVGVRISGSDGVIDHKLLGTAFIGLLLWSRFAGMKMGRTPVVVMFGVMSIAMGVVVVSLFRMPSAPLPPVGLDAGSLVEPGGLLVFMFAMQMRVGAVLWRPLDASRPTNLKYTAPVNIALVAGCYFLLVWQIENVANRPDSPTPPTFLSTLRLADSSDRIYILALVVLIAMMLGTCLAWLDDSVHLAGVLMRSNALPDIFTPRRDTSVQPLGELVVAAGIVLAMFIGTSPGQLLAMAVFGVLLGFLVLNLAAAVVSPPTTRWILVFGAVLCLVNLLALSPESAIAGITVIATAIVVRSIYIVWTGTHDGAWLDEGLARPGIDEPEHEPRQEPTSRDSA